MRAFAPFLAVGLIAALTGCEESGSSQADCSTRIRYEGRTYEEVGFSSKPATKSPTKALQAGCDDVGENSDGVTFDHGTFKTEVWTFPGQPDVLGLPMGDDTYRVMVPLHPSDAFINELHKAGLLNAGQD